MRPIFAATAVSAVAISAGLAISGARAVTLDSATADDPFEITMFYPIMVGGPLERVMDGLVEDFEAEHPHISVQAVYSGNYDETSVQVTSAIRAGDPPATTVQLSIEMFQLAAEGVIVPFDDVVETDEERAWLDSFYDAFMLNSRDGEGLTWGIPFQRSTIVQYWNKEAFEQAGLDPDHAPQDWDELREIAATVQADSDVEWGVQMPSSTATAFWIFQAFAAQNGVEVVNAEGTEVYFDQPEVIEALEYWIGLAEDGVHPPGIVNWGTTPEDFLQGATAMIWTTTGNLSNIRSNAEFDFGVDMLPAGERRGSPTGGGNFYLVADATPDEQRAAMKLIRFMTAPEQLARWTIDTGYVAPRPDAWETATLRDHVAEFPAAAMARDQLEHAVRELATYERGRINELFDNALQAAIIGESTAAEAMAAAQAEADTILAPYR